MMGNTAQPIDNSLETLLNAGNYRDRIRFITVPRIKDVQRRADFKKKNGKSPLLKQLLIAVQQLIFLPNKLPKL